MFLESSLNGEPKKDLAFDVSHVGSLRCGRLFSVLQGAYFIASNMRIISIEHCRKIS